MVASFQYFRWQRFDGGYEWRDAEVVGDLDPRAVARGQRFLMRRDVEAANPVTDPLSDEPALFKRFARLDGTERSFAEFAGRYGLLGISRSIKAARRNATGEPFSLWLEEWRRMRAVVTLIDEVKSLDEKRLSRY